MLKYKLKIEAKAKGKRELALQATISLQIIDLQLVCILDQ